MKTLIQQFLSYLCAMLSLRKCSQGKHWKIESNLEQTCCPECCANRGLPADTRVLLPGVEAQCPDCGIIWSEDDIVASQQQLHNLLTKNDDWTFFDEAQADPSTATYRRPLRDSHGTHYVLSCYCWRCNQYTLHSRSEFSYTGDSWAQCMRCGMEWCWQTLVTTQIPGPARNC